MNHRVTVVIQISVSHFGAYSAFFIDGCAIVGEDVFLGGHLLLAFSEWVFGWDGGLGLEVIVLLFEVIVLLFKLMVGSENLDDESFLFSKQYIFEQFSLPIDAISCHFRSVHESEGASIVVLLEG
jgi:hypothetical protein